MTQNRCTCSDHEHSRSSVCTRPWLMIYSWYLMAFASNISFLPSSIFHSLVNIDVMWFFFFYHRHRHSLVPSASSFFFITRYSFANYTFIQPHQLVSLLSSVTSRVWYLYQNIHFDKLPRDFFCLLDDVYVDVFMLSKGKYDQSNRCVRLIDHCLLVV